MSDNKKIKLVNYYEKWREPGDEDHQQHYPLEEVIQIRIPFRGVLQGASGSGKTNIAMNMIRLFGPWHKIVILAKNLEEFLYKKAIKYIKEIEAAEKRKLLIAIDDIKELPPLDTFLLEEKTLMLVDDFVADDPKSLKPLEHIWLRGRKNGISPVFISQSYFDTPKMIRKNSDYVFMKQVGPKDMKRIAAEYALEETPKEITAKYSRIDTADNTQFFLIDRLHKDPRYRFRDCFDPMD